MPPNRQTAKFLGAVGRNAKWSTLQTVISAVAVFVLYKYIYSRLGAELLGLWAVVLASVSVGRLAEMGFSTTILRYVSQHLSKNSKEHAARIVETGLVSVGIPVGLLLLLLYPLIHWAIKFVVPLASLDAAWEVLPYAIATLWIGIIGSITQSALDGCGRMDVKSKILILGNLFYVPAGVLFVNYWGVLGLAAAQLMQAVMVTGLVWIATRRELPHLNWLPLNWNRNCFKEIIGYAAGLQLGNMLVMLFEPVTKMLLSRYCGLTEVAHFEMANQVVARVRALVTSAMQAYLPVLSSLDSKDDKAARRVVGEALTFAVGIGVTVMAALVVTFPVVSILWIGNEQAGFIAYGRILGVGWLLATLAMPAYFYCVGAGRIKALLSGQVLSVGLNAALGFSAALSGNGLLVACSMMVALVAGNLVTLRQAMADLRFTAVEVIRSRSARNLLRVVVLTALILASDIGISVMAPMEINVWAVSVAHAVALLLVFLFSDARAILVGRFRTERA